MQEGVQTESLADFRRVEEWQRERGGSVFRSLGALQWFIRQHKTRLLDRGVLITRFGPGGNLLAAAFEREALAIIREQAR